MTINALYSILVGDADISGADTWFIKRHYPIVISKEAEQLRDKLVAGIEEAKLPLFACCVCWLALNTIFAEQIIELDSNNTYVCPTRPDTADSSDSSVCSTAVLKPVKSYIDLIMLVDKDIQDRVDPQSLPSVLGAICLQLLRGSK